MAINYRHPSCPDFVLNLTAVTMATVLFVHGRYGADDECDSCCIFAAEADDGERVHERSLRIKMNKFVAESADLKCGVQQLFRDRNKLSCLFKDSVPLALLHAANDGEARAGVVYATRCAETGFSGLWPELKLKILSYLDARSVTRMEATCREMRELARDNALWRRLFRRRFRGERCSVVLF